MNIVVVGLSHKTAPVEIREKIAFEADTLAGRLAQVLALPSISEAMIVSTCNRVELYAASMRPEQACAELQRFIGECHGVSADELNAHLYSYTCQDAVRHVFRVTASLDSMVVGEPQILGQIKTAYGHACDCKSAGLVLNRFMHKAFSVAKRVRTETAIASNAVSVSYAAVELARKIFDSLENKTVMLVGAGEMCELAAKHFVRYGVSKVLVTNRTFSRAESLAESFDGVAVNFANFREQLHRVDILLSSTGSPDYVISAADLKAACKIRRYQPMFLIDIAVPRDIDPAAGKIDSVYLYDVDDLQGVVQSNLKEREKEAVKADQIVTQEVGRFHDWLSNLTVRPTIVALRKQLEEVRRKELQRTLSSLGNLDEHERKMLDAMTSAIVNKILHHPTRLLKQRDCDDDKLRYLDAVQMLFDLSVQPPSDDLPELPEE
ncbi:glutamyl-tRNA reductase [Pelovirga terrestris]|uniref:Glutamyl-tRNA reductase n=1 Tax=Pelovirga terrestris TaxID=2771352 RepID=A0A8J6QR86_9BACT|nr:glutamyl-tRNA reductase [Pelovirga terrestris]MBD1400718.1 glutamyl-tRNA reductase [Pelovirga terrestris]